ncbi:spore coat protein [Brevibacillus laterosporus]
MVIFSNYAAALTEVATPDVRTILHKQLDECHRYS